MKASPQLPAGKALERHGGDITRRHLRDGLAGESVRAAIDTQTARW